MPCPFASALGIPHKGFHEARIGNYAYNDVIGTFGLAWLTSYLFNIDIKKSLLSWFVAGQVMHYAFGVKTAFLEDINMSPNCDDTAILEDIKKTPNSDDTAILEDIKMRPNYDDTAILEDIKMIHKCDNTAIPPY